jgi:ABC-type branched-subunit amino acid transport system substrate-binding protein
MVGEKRSRRSFISAVGAGVVGLAVGFATGSQFLTRPERIIERTVTQPGAMATVEKIVTTTHYITATVTPKPPREILIGGTLPITGAYATEWGPIYRDLVLTWADMINERGGLFVKEYGQRLPVKVIIYDDESNPDKAVELYEKLATVDKVDLFIGPATSPITIRASTVAEKYNIPMVAVEANSPAIFARGFKWLVGVIEPATTWSKPYFEILKPYVEKGVFKSIAIIADDTPHTNDIAIGAERYAKEVGLKVISFEIVPYPTKDFTALIVKLKGLNPDIVWLAQWGDTAVTFRLQAEEQGLKPKEWYIRFMSPALLGKLGNLAERVISASYTSRRIVYGDVKFWEELSKRIGIKDVADLPWFCIRTAALDTIKAAIEYAGTLDKAKLMETLATMHTVVYAPAHNGIMYFRYGFKWIADKEYTLDGVGTVYAIPIQVQKGKIEVIGPPELATSQYIPPG